MVSDNSQMGPHSHSNGPVPLEAYSEFGWANSAEYNPRDWQAAPPNCIAPELLFIEEDRGAPRIIITDTAQSIGPSGSQFGIPDGNSYPQSMAAILHPPSEDLVGHTGYKRVNAGHNPVRQRPTRIERRRIPRHHLNPQNIRAAIESQLVYPNEAHMSGLYNSHVGGTIDQSVSQR